MRWGRVGLCDGLQIRATPVLFRALVYFLAIIGTETPSNRSRTTVSSCQEYTWYSTTLVGGCKSHIFNGMKIALTGAYFRENLTNETPRTCVIAKKSTFQPELTLGS